MSQILNIFQKDARHHWPEVLVAWAIIAIYIWDQPRKWADQTFGIRFIDGLLNMLPVLLILSWAFLITRLIQSETLVGDRQFWITRPYRWHGLLAAKLLSILGFIDLPLFIGQIVLLKLAHFPIMRSMWGLVEIHLMFVAFLLAGALALAVVTPSVGQTALALLLLVVLILGMAWLNSLVPNAAASSDTDGLQAILYLACCGTLVLVQYKYRRILLARLVIVCTIVLITLVFALAPYEALFRRDYPLPTKDHPLPAKLTFDRSLSFAHEGKEPSRWMSDETSLELPFQITDMDHESLVQLEAMRLDLELPGGKHWTSHWHSLSNVISYGRTRTWPSISIETKFYEGIKNKAVIARVFLGMRSFRLGVTSAVTVAGDRTSLPGNTRCVDNLTENWLQCFSALRRPKPIVIMAELPNSDCPVSDQATAAEPWANVPAAYYDLGLDTGPDSDISPIQDFSIGLSKFYYYEDHEIRLPVCSGTRLLVSKPELQYAVRDEMDLGEIMLVNYHPTFPRKIIPPAHRPLKAPSDSLSENFAPEVMPSKTKIAAD